MVENEIFTIEWLFMPIKLIVIAAFLVIVLSLASALYHLVKNKDDEASQKTFRALALRIGLSVLLFVLIFIGFASGLIPSQGIGARIQQIRQQQNHQP